MFQKNSLYFFKHNYKKITFIIIFNLFVITLLYLVTAYKPSLQSYYLEEKETYTLLEISDEQFLDKIMFGNPEEVRQLINSGANTNAIDETGRNGLSIAAIFNNKPNMAMVLSNGGVSINSQDANGYTPLMLAIISGGSTSYTFIHELLTLGADPNMLTISGVSTLSIAVGSSDNLDVIRDLINFGADINYTNMDGSTPLMIAAKINTNYEIIDLLIDNGAKIKYDDIGVSIYNIASTNPALSSNDEFMERIKSLE